VTGVCRLQVQTAVKLQLSVPCALQEPALGSLLHRKILRTRFLRQSPSQEEKSWIIKERARGSSTMERAKEKGTGQKRKEIEKEIGREQRKAREMVMEEVKERRVKKEIKATGKAKERVKERVTKVAKGNAR